MVTFICVDCGQNCESKVSRSWARRCKACAAKARQAGQGPIQRRRQRAGVAASVRELKANFSDLLRTLEENPGAEIAITRHGKPCARLMAIAEGEGAASPGELVSIRGIYANRHNASEADFEEAKRVWEPAIGL